MLPDIKIDFKQRFDPRSGPQLAGTYRLQVVTSLDDGTDANAYAQTQIEKEILHKLEAFGRAALAKEILAMISGGRQVSYIKEYCEGIRQ